MILTNEKNLIDTSETDYDDRFERRRRRRRPTVL